MSAQELQQTHALLLSSQPFREKDKIVRLLTQDFGKISSVAHSAAQSKKRFPPALLEGFVHVKANLRPPVGDLHQRAEALWTLEKADLVQTFDHLRTGYHEIAVGSFGLRLVQDIVPDGPTDVTLFRSLGRYLRDSAVTNLSATSWWVPVAFWTWFTHHLGFGDLTQEFEKRQETVTGFWNHWHETLARPEADFVGLFKIFASASLPKLRQSDMVLLYERWLQLSSINWPYFEQGFLVSGELR